MPRRTTRCARTTTRGRRAVRALTVLGLCAVVALLAGGLSVAKSDGDQAAAAGPPAGADPLATLLGSARDARDPAGTVFYVDSLNDTIWGFEWPAGAPLTIVVADGGAGASSFADADEWGEFALGDLGGFDLAAGHEVTVSDGETTKTHVVTALRNVEVDAAADTVSGYAESGSEVCAVVPGGPVRWAHADDETGAWVADFSVPGIDWWDDPFDITPGMEGYAEQPDADGDATRLGWKVPFPRFRVDPQDDMMWGFGWPAGAELTVTIDDGGAGAVFPAEANDWGDFQLQDTGGFDIQAGHMVTVAAGETTKTHVVTALRSVEADADADTVSGIAEPGSEVRVGIHGGPARSARADDVTGEWTADFSEAGPEPWDDPFDIAPGMDGYAGQTDEDGDATWLFWVVHNPHFRVDPDKDVIWGQGWPAHAALTITIADGGGGASFTTDAGEWGYFGLQDTGGFDIQAGHEVTVGDGETTKTHVVTALRSVEADADADTVSGIAEPGSDVRVGIHGGPVRSAHADDVTGEWTADFSEAGPEPWDDPFDIAPGMDGYAEQPDHDSDATWVGWRVPGAPGPEGTFAVNGGAPFTASAGVTLDSDVTGAAEMRFRNAACGWGDWQPYAASAPWLLNSGDGTFAAKVDFATGTNPRAVVVGDFDGDGRQDLATANATANTVSVLLGDGDGGFAPTAVYSTGSGPYFITVGDFDGDGRQDLATANWQAASVSVLLGDGSGGFAAKTDFATGASPHSITVGDFDGDGRQDLATANYGDHTVSVLLGDGSGGFAAKADFATGLGPLSIAVGDFDGDGRQDLATANLVGSSTSVLLGDGSGGFAAKADFATGTHARAIAVGDFDGDGRQDLATVNYSAHTLSVLLGDGSGGFAAKADFATGTNPNAIAVGDFDGDGRQDIATANYSGHTVSVLLGDGSGGFATKADFATGRNPNAVVVGDFDGDGRQDLATADYDPSTVSVLLGQGTSQGTKVVEAQYRDEAGNVLDARGAIVLDTEPPTVSDNADGAWHHDFLLAFFAADAGSGVDHVAYRLGDGEWQTGDGLYLRTWKRGGNSGVHTVTYRAVDGAGNVSEEAACEVRLDARYPRTLDDAPRDGERAPIPQAQDVSVSLSASDAHSGVAGTWWSLDLETWHPYEEAILIAAPADGSNDDAHWVFYYSVDAAGNQEYLQRCLVIIDTSGG